MRREKITATLVNQNQSYREKDIDFLGIEMGKYKSFFTTNIKAIITYQNNIIYHS